VNETTRTSKINSGAGVTKDTVPRGGKKTFANVGKTSEHQHQRWQYCSVNLWAVFLSCSIFALRENEDEKKAAVEAAAFQTIIFSRK
jgi:hypothetical protein